MTRFQGDYKGGFSFSNFRIIILILILSQSFFAIAGVPTRAQQSRILMNAIRARNVSPEMGQMIDHLDAYRKAIRDRHRFQGRAPWKSDDNPRDIVEGEMITNIADLDEFRSLSLAKNEDNGESAPWSDTYWPLYAGQLADRYQDHTFTREVTWQKNFKNFTSTTPKDVNKWSVAEKYDFVLGLNPRSKTNSLTGQAWASTQSQAVGGKVEAWMGICHGWASAAMVVDRPLRSVKVMGSDGVTPVTFYADEIKGLVSLLYATGNHNQNFIGGRCNVKLEVLVKAGADARAEYPECFDTNAGTWHLVALNQLRKGRSFVIDSTLDFEVWNQPVKSLKYRYFNPQSGKATNSLVDANVPLEEFTNDPFAEYRRKRKGRTKKITSVVGVEMRLTWVAENVSTTWNWPKNRDLDETVGYKYDLELDSDGNIIGGEWYDHLNTYAHPDFIWAPTYEMNGRKKKARVIQDFRGPNWDLASPAPAAWRDAAFSWASFDQPLAAFVDQLVRASRN